ncbi:hypothetical protein [Photobacterium ganghwense]|uniref:hypothetical protein n=1 Tax=Photobacterium ganghwense TaxID=320778 RepID=UPI001A8E9764|nr:hypothetical protein [Photobacterium ganghwense]QSV17645.1 hypothetical protein FH974_25490 [Photobacterium ganghwense]
MGFISFIADGDTSIANVRSSHHSGRPVYLVQPNGQASICEPSYSGYGVFGGCDAFMVLAKNNMPKSTLAMFSGQEEVLRNVGISLFRGLRLYATPCDAYIGPKYHLIAAAALGYLPDVILLHDDTDQLTVQRQAPCGLIAAEGRDTVNYKGTVNTLNKFVVDGIFHKLILPQLKWPLKFSFNAEAYYDDLPPTEECPYQGFFYTTESLVQPDINNQLVC